jgi:C4-dicarboxylate transporter DctM subunit
MAALFSGMPVAFALGAGGLIYLLLQGAAPATLASQLFGSLSSSGLMAIPFFILAAEIMSRSGATGRLITLIDTMIRHTRGGMPLIAVIATAMFSSICGSSVATAAAIGTVLLPELKERGYDPVVSVGLIATAGGLGILIPPSVPLVVYGMVTETSIGKLFAAGGIVGVALTFLLGIAAYIYGVRSGVAPRPRASWAEMKEALLSASGVLLSPIIVLGGIYGGLFTPMEAAAVSSVYAMILAVFYGYRGKELLPLLSGSATISSVIMMILAGAQLFGYVITNERVPNAMFTSITELGLTPTMFIGCVMLFFLIAGMFLEVISIILISMPILMPLLVSFDIDPIFFAVLLILNMEIAVITPPIGLNLFTISAISNMPVMTVFRGSLPFTGILLAFLAALAFIPGVSSFFAYL